MNLIIADATLHDFRGHSFEYSRSLSSAAQERGMGCVTLAPQRASGDIARHLHVVPCFTYHHEHVFKMPLPIRRYRARWNQWVHGRMILQDLKEVESHIETSSESIVLVPTVYMNLILPFVHWAEQLPRERRPQFVLVCHASAYEEVTDSDHVANMYRQTFARIERSETARHFHVFTDSDELADEYRGYTKLPVAVVPIPHSGGTADCEAHAPRRRQPDQPIRLTQIGFSNGANKGFQMFAPLLSRLRQELESGKIVAELQASVTNFDANVVHTTLRRLREMPGVTLREGALSTEEYYGLLDRADIVVQPYNTRTYHSQTSGVFAEAVAHGKPVVIPRGTWMARQLKQHAAGVMFIPNDAQSLYEAVLEAVDRYDELAELAAQRAEPWRKRHCVASYLDTIFNTIGVG